MSTHGYTVRARDQVLRFIDEPDLDRLAGQACEAAERSDGWAPGAERVYPIAEPRFVVPGLDPSALVVAHWGNVYDVTYFDGPLAERVTDDC